MDWQDDKKNYTLLVSQEKKERIDLFLSRELNFTRNRIQQLIKDNFITVNGISVKASVCIKKNDEIKVHIPAPKETGLLPQDIKIDIIYEDRDVLVINKPPGLVVHPAKGHEDNTLVNAVLYHCPDLEGINDEMRPGIVHRLDKDTSGIMVVAKNQNSHNSLAEQIKDRKTLKEYIALIKGVPIPQEGTINEPIGRHPVNRKKMAVQSMGREAVTHYRVEKTYNNIYSLIRLKLETGRTHQIRVHLSYMGYPILGDQVYGKQKNIFGLTRQALHSCKLGFTHPSLNTWMEFYAPVAEDIKEAIEKLEKE